MVFRALGEGRLTMATKPRSLGALRAWGASQAAKGYLASVLVACGQEKCNECVLLLTHHEITSPAGSAG